ncbi:MAG: hypothetical protein GVY26_16875 [Bacteroidetes bacterium]|jgi:hypothetical protein|nr:hypothetical protein [Bacteroidota bacterium]
MRNILLFAALLSSQFSPAQERFVSNEAEGFYDWFHQRSQVAQLYQDQTTLYTFTENTKVYTGPCQQSATVATLPLAHPVTNIAYQDDYYLPESEINGYGDLWYHVKGQTPEGQPFTGYVFGTHIAKGWRQADLNGDRQAEFLMMGVSPEPRQNLRDIKAELRIVDKGRLTAQKVIPGLCLFEDCASSPLLRTNTTAQGFTIIEASTMTVGCWAGIERAFYYYDGEELSRVYHAEYTTSTEYADEAFVVASGTSAQICEYSHQGENYLPVWSCQTIDTDNGRAAVALQERQSAQAK